MLFTQMAYIGVDPSGGRKPFNYAALDADGKLMALGDGEMEDALAFIGGQQAAFVAVNAPSGPNRGLVRRQMEDRSLTPHQIRGADMRLAEFELRQRGITVSGTPGRSEQCPAWVQAGFAFYRKLAGMGFVPYPAEDGTRVWLETHPYACFCALLEQTPLSKPTLEGRLQRQLALYDQGLGIRDGMDFFEEITRYKLARGILPMEVVYTPEALDALAAAHTAYVAATRPDEVNQVGDKEEGVIVLPVKELKEKY